MNYNIGQAVKVKLTNERGVITDKMFSEAKGLYVYIIKPDDGGRSIMRDEDAIEEIKSETTYKVETDIADNVVIGIIYKIVDGQKVEVTRGHGHIIHEDEVGIAQACAYAYKRAFMKIDDGIYYKQFRDE